MNLYLYLSLIIINTLFFIKAIRVKLFIKSPLFAIYFYSVFFLNIIGSSVVFFPSLSPYGTHNYFTLDFFYILFIQSISFWIFLPFQLRNSSSLGLDNSFLGLSRLVRVSLIFLLGSLVLVGLFVLLNGLPPFYSTDLSLGNRLLIEERTTFFSIISFFWVYEIGFYTIPQIVSVILFINSRLNRKRKNTILFLIVLAYSSLTSLSFLHKSPLVLLFLNIFIAQLLFFSKKISFFIKLKYVILFSVLIFFGYYIALSGNEVDEIFPVFWGITNRVFGVYPLSLAVATNFVESFGLYYGRALPNFFGLFTFDQVNLAQLIHYHVFQIKGSAPPPAIGYAYANFGYFGVFLHPFLIHICIIFYTRVLKRINNKIFAVSLFCFFSIKTMFLSMTSVFDNLLNPRDLIVIFTIYIAYKFLWR